MNRDLKNVLRSPDQSWEGLGVSLFFIVNLSLFWLAGRAGIPYVGIAFFIWVGIFNNAVVAQFWSYGNDLLDKPTGERLFPVIGIGATLGSPLGAAFAGTLFKRRADPYNLLQLAVAAWSCRWSSTGSSNAGKGHGGRDQTRRWPAVGTALHCSSTVRTWA
jgi:ABC-type branched-subunit amino acid transport system permease subunit